jgi:hypothetical protein
MMKKFTKMDPFLPVLPIVLLTSYYLICMKTAFQTHQFAFHDLTLLCDLFHNGVHFSAPFTVTDTHIHHFALYFTPSLYLLYPLFYIFDSQFLFIALGVLAAAWGVYLSVRILEKFLIAIPKQKSKTLILSLFSTFLMAHLFLKADIVSAHVGIFFFAAALLVLHLLLDNAPWGYLLASTALALGIRQDCGYFLFFMFLAVTFVPKEILAPRAKIQIKAVSLALISVAYVLVVVLFVMPRWGGGGMPSNWTNWGSTWQEMVWNVLRSPIKVISMSLIDSGFFPIHIS